MGDSGFQVITHPGYMAWWEDSEVYNWRYPPKPLGGWLDDAWKGWDCECESGKCRKCGHIFRFKRHKSVVAWALYVCT